MFRMSLDQKVALLVSSLRRFGKDMRLTEAQLNQEIVRVVRIYQTSHLDAFKKALKYLGVLEEVTDKHGGVYYVWGKEAENVSLSVGGVQIDANSPRKPVCLYLNAQAVEELKKRGVNLSQLVNDYLLKVLKEGESGRFDNSVSNL
jgi:ABC-type hemin transport system substrate-binding protein